jgi:adenosine kinase
VGNPLLDIQVTNGEELLKKYDLNANDAILAGEKQAEIYDDVVKNYKVTYIAGGASQNAARGAAYILPPNSVAFTGCVGDDDLAEQLKVANKCEGLRDVYMVKKGEQTGACAVVITGHFRSLCTTLRSAEKFDISHLKTPEVAKLIESAKVIYLEGYFLTHGLASALELGKNTTAAGKVFALNFSAPFIAQFFTDQVQQVMPYVDILIGNEAEAEAWANAVGLPDPKDIKATAKAVAALPKSNPSRPRVVVFTQGVKHTVLVSSKGEEKDYAVVPLTDEEIVDTNGAGDAFAGGFLGAFVAGKNLDECVDVGHKLARMCVCQVGPQYVWPKVPILSQ